MPVTFDVTTTLLRDRFFPAGIQTGAGETAAQQAIEDVAADIEVLLRAARVEPEDIIEAHAPRSFLWLQNTLLKGAAAELAVRVPMNIDPTLWREDYQARLRDLERKQEVVLGDLATRTRTTTAHYNPR